MGEKLTLNVSPFVRHDTGQLPGSGHGGRGRFRADSLALSLTIVKLLLLLELIRGKNPYRQLGNRHHFDRCLC